MMMAWGKWLFPNNYFAPYAEILFSLESSLTSKCGLIIGLLTFEINFVL